MNKQKPEEILEGSYSDHTVKDSRYYERALKLQAQKIERQRDVLAKLNAVYTRDVESAKVWEVLKFLAKIIIKNITK